MIVVVFYMGRRRLARDTRQLSPLRARPPEVILYIALLRRRRIMMLPSARRELFSA